MTGRADRGYRAAIVGCGRKAATLDDEVRCRINYSIPPDTHAAAYQLIPSVRLVAAADPNDSKRRVMQARYRTPAVYADYREMFAKERPDLVSITTRAPLHAEVTIAAAEAGAKGVLCEKAMATSLAEADAMITACRRAGTVLMVNHTRRWHPTFERAARLVRGGAIGALRCVVGVCPGPLIHNGTHLFDAMRLFGGEVAWVTGHVRSEALEDAPGHAMLGFQSGAIGLVDLDSAIGFAVELQGATGRLFIDPTEDGVTVWEYQDPPPPEGQRAWYQGRPCRERVARHVPGGGGRGTLVAAIEELTGCIEAADDAAPSGGRRNRSSGEDGRAALEIALAVYSSHAHDGARVALPLPDRNLTVTSR